MLRNLLTFICILGTLFLNAQNKDSVKKNNTKTTETPIDTKVDYTAIGADMPPLIGIPVDTVLQNGAVKKHKNSFLKKKRNTINNLNIITNNDLKIGANLFVMIFNPTCSHCVEETEILKKNLSLFHKSRLLMVANRSTAIYVTDFVKQRNTRKYSQITVAMDSTNFISQAYLYKALPQINVYDKNLKLLKSFCGDLPIDSLKQYIQ